MTKFAIFFILLMCILRRPVRISGQDVVISSNIIPGTSTVTTAQLIARIEQLERIIALLTGCRIPAIENVSTNTSLLLRNNEFVMFTCDGLLQPRGVAVRQCLLGQLTPSLITSPFLCRSRQLNYVFVKKWLNWNDAQAHCVSEYNGNLLMDGIDTKEGRKKICKQVGISKSYVHIGISRDNPSFEWRRIDNGDMTNFQFDWYENYPKKYKYLQLSCKKWDSYGTVYDYEKAKYFICQYQEYE